MVPSWFSELCRLLLHEAARRGLCVEFVPPRPSCGYTEEQRRNDLAGAEAVRRLAERRLRCPS